MALCWCLTLHRKIGFCHLKPEEVNVAKLTLTAFPCTLSFFFFFSTFLAPDVNLEPYQLLSFAPFPLKALALFTVLFASRACWQWMTHLRYWTGEPGKWPNERCAFVLHRSKVSLYILEIFKTKDLTVGVLYFSNIY